MKQGASAWKLGALGLATVFLASQISSLRIRSDFSDLIPQGHPFVRLHREIRDLFGGANAVTLSLEALDADLFTADTLDRLHRLTLAVDELPGVNHDRVSSLTHRNARRLTVTETGGIRSDPFYHPSRPPRTPEELSRLRDEVRSDPLAHGLLVSKDLKAAVVRAQFRESDLDDRAVFAGVQAARAALAAPGIRIHATGHPVLVGWIHSQLPRLLPITLGTVALLVLLLAFYFRRLYGVLLPLAGVLLSAVWGLGAAALMGLNLEPLTLVIPFLISASGMCHGIQILERFYAEYDRTGDRRGSARAAFAALRVPAALTIATDALGILVNAAGSVPLLVKTAVSSGAWSLSALLTILVALPLLLAVLPPPRRRAAAKSGRGRRAWARVGDAVSRPAPAKKILAAGLAAMLVAAVLGARSGVAGADPGAAIMYPGHDYNVSARAINARFPGSEELYVIARAERDGGLKNPAALRAMESLSRRLLEHPAVGAAKGLPGLLRQVNRLTHDDDPRWAQLPRTPREAGGLLFAFMAASPVPGALKEFIDTDERRANLVFYLKNLRPETAHGVLAEAREWLAVHGTEVPGLTFELAGGAVGVAAAAHEAVLRDQFLIVPLALLLAFALVAWTYRSLHAGWLMVLPMAFGTLMTQAFMAAWGIDIDFNTIPVFAVGIGMGDYAIYTLGRVREEAAAAEISKAVSRAVATTGGAILFTAAALLSGILLWPLLSDWEYAAQSAMLLAVMISANAAGAIFLVPAWITVFRPAFLDAARSR